MVVFITVLLEAVICITEFNWIEKGGNDRKGMNQSAKSEKSDAVKVADIRLQFLHKPQLSVRCAEDGCLGLITGCLRGVVPRASGAGEVMRPGFGVNSPEQDEADHRASSGRSGTADGSCSFEKVTSPLIESSCWP